MPTQQSLPLPTLTGVGRGGRRLSDLHYCHHCRIHFANVSVYNIHCDLHSVKFDCVCSFCGDRLLSITEFSLHMLHKHIDRQQDAMQTAQPSNDDDTAESSTSKRTRNSNEPFVE